MVPPVVQPTVTSGAPPTTKGDPESLQRACEATGTMSTPSSWETVDGGTGDGLRGEGLHEHDRGGMVPPGIWWCFQQSSWWGRLAKHSAGQKVLLHEVEGLPEHLVRYN